MYVGMIETRFLKISLKSFHENYSDLFKKQHATSLMGRWGGVNSSMDQEN